MRIEVKLIAVALLVLAFGVLPAQAQYSEIYRLDKAVSGLEDKVVLKVLRKTQRCVRDSRTTKDRAESFLRAALHGARIGQSHQ